MNEMLENNVFAKIVAKKMPASIIYENDYVLVIQDITPQAPIHLLILPKDGFENIQQAEEKNLLFGQHVFKTAQYLSQTIPGAKEFKLVMNNGYSAGQRVFYAHVHFMAGF